MADVRTETEAGAGPGDGHGDRRTRRKGMSERALARVFVAPSIILMAAVALFPVIYAFVLSLYSYRRRQQTGFGGLDNYVEALGDDRFWAAVQFTLIFTVASVAAEFLIGLGFALLMNQTFRGRGVTRAAILIPWVIPTVVAAQMWFFMFNVTPGFINNLFGLGDFAWLGQPGWPIFAVIFADVWKTAPFVALLLLAGLQTIPAEMGESGVMDGANALQRLWYITLPLLRPAILVALLFRTVEALRVYDLVAVMTGGAFETESLSLLVQEFVVRTPDPGYGAALSTITFVIILGIGLVFVSMLGRDIALGRGGER